MQNVILSPLSLDELKKELLLEVIEHLDNRLNKGNKPELEWLCRKDAAKQLGVSLPTLLQWTKTGVIQGYRIGSRVRYKKAELNATPSKIQTNARRNQS